MRSDAVKTGTQQAPHRSLFNALGMTKEEMDRPLVGIVSSYNEIVPGHMNLDKITQAVKLGSLHQKGAWSLYKSSVHPRKKAPCLPQKQIFRSRSPLSQASALFQLLILFHMDIIKSTHRMINRCCQIKDRE